MITAALEERFLCLDMLCVSWVNRSGKASSDCAIVMEIWNSGAILQSETTIPQDSILTIETPGGPVRAKVSSCTQDDYGFLVQVVVDPTEHWFPESYHPIHLLPSAPA
ncbi:MAG: PilZ protein [Bryobacterales bacterium]|jgi:hypothetical protein|nr:PilZ protein [Bryobacterales bacterium]